MRFRYLMTLCAIAAFPSLAGCQRSNDTGRDGEVVSPTVPSAAPSISDDPQVVAAIEATEGAVVRRSATSIVELDLRALASDDGRSLVEEFRWTRGLPGLQTLSAAGPGVTDEAVAQLADHPSLSVLKFEGSRSLSNAGVAVAKDLPRLTDISLEDSQITDESLKLLAQSDTIRRIRAPRTNLSDRGVRYLADAPQLELLDLLQCSGISDASLSTIGNLPHMRNLRVSGSRITDGGLKHLAGLGNIAALGLQHTAISDAGVAHLEGLKSLKEINLYGTPITDAALDSLAELPVLAKARFRETGIRGERSAALAKMQAMRDLDLSESPVQDAALENIGKITALRSLNLWLTEVTDEGIEHLQDLEKLTRLNLDNVTGITDASLDIIGEMSKLDLLHLGGTSITDEGLPKLYGLKNLRTLFITRTGVSQQAHDELKENMPWLQRIEY